MSKTEGATLTYSGVALPVKLGAPTLIEFLLEVQFEPSVVSAGDVLPGLLFNRYRDTHGGILRAPSSAILKQAREQDPRLKYLATSRLVGPSGHVLLGDRVFGVSAVGRYPGWSEFRKEAVRVIDAMKDTQTVKHVERASIKAVNVIPIPEGHQLGALACSIQMYGKEIGDFGLVLRSEHHTKNHVAIVELATNTAIQVNNGVPVSGLMISVDILPRVPPPIELSEIALLLDPAHEELKRRFFGLLTPETIASLKPEYK